MTADWRAIPGNEAAFERLVQAIRYGHAIAFVGAGASAGLYPLWTGLIRLLAAEAVDQGLAMADDQAYWLDPTTKPQQAARGIKQALGSGTYADVLRRIFSPRRGADGHFFTPVQQHLLQLGFRGIVTTNYDPGLLEARKAVRPLCAGVGSGFATWRDQDTITRWLTGAAFEEAACPILFAHGYYERSETIVLGAGEYRDAYRSDQPFLQLMKALWGREQLVFVGFGFSDPWLDFIVDAAISETGVRATAAPQHVAVISLSRAYTPELRRSARDAYNADPLFYPVTRDAGGSESHSILLTILEELCARTASSTGTGDLTAKFALESADVDAHGVNAAPGPAASKTLEDLVSDFLGADPVAGDDAIDTLAKGGPDQLRALLRQTNTERQHIIRMRKLSARIGSDAMPVLIEAIRDGTWGEKLRAAPCFTEFTGFEANNALYQLLEKQDFDVQRLAIEATGHAGYSSDIRWNLVRLAKYDDLQREYHGINDYSFGKLSEYVVEALARGFARTGDPSELEHLGKFMELCAEKGRGGYAETAFGRAFEDLTPAAADALIACWLPRPDGPYARLALRGLGRLRLRRASVAAVSYLFDGRDDVSEAAGICLGNTGCDTVARKLAEALGANTTNTGTAWAFSMLYSRDTDWPNGEQYLAELLPGNSEIAGRMLVSAAQRRPEAVLDKARHGLADIDSYYRGASALATAWARPADAKDLLGQADDEASNALERLFIIAAQVLAGLRDRGQALNEALKATPLWPLLEPFWRLQVLAAVQLSGLDQRYAKLWAEISRDNTTRTQALVQDYARRASRAV